MKTIRFILTLILGLAKAYECLGLIDEAMSVIEEGFYNTKDSRLVDMANELNVSGTLPRIRKLLSEPVEEPVDESAETQNAIFNELSSETMVIEDEKLEEALRLLLEKPDGDICLKDFAGMYELNLTELGITDITPLKNLTSLKKLQLKNNNIPDTSPLKELKELKQLDISPES